MSRRIRSQFGQIVMCAATFTITLAVAPRAQAQSGSQYYIFDVGVLGGSPAFSQALGISEVDSSGNVLVVGRSSASGQSHAYVLTYQSALGLSPTSLHDLNSLSSASSSLQSRALGVNQYGEIAGAAWPSTSTAFLRATSWVIASGAATAYALPAPGPILSASVTTATSVSEGSPSWVAGTGTGVDCPDGSDPDGPCKSCQGTIRRAFRCAIDGSSFDALDYPADADGDGGPANDINNSANAVNASGECAGEASPCDVGPGCGGRSDAAGWSSPTSTNELTSLPLPSITDPHGEHAARGINESGNMTGYGYALPGTGSVICGKRVPYWDGISATPVNVHVDSGMDDLEETHGNALTNPDACDQLTVVGQEVTQGLAWIWKRDSSANWSNASLTTLIPSNLVGFSAGQWNFLLEAHDINDAGWIVGRGQKQITTGTSQERGFIAVPVVTCWADLNHDCKINGLDLAIILGAWGNPGCMGSIICFADLNQDGKVDGLDNAIVLGAWTGSSPCGECPSSCESESSAFAGGSSSQPTLAGLIEEFEFWGFGDLISLLVQVWEELHPQ